MATITICDICGERDNVHKRSYPYDIRMDGAGGRETIAEEYDLCVQHELLVVKEAVRRFLKDKTDTKIDSEFKINRYIIDDIKRRIKNYGQDRS